MRTFAEFAQQKGKQGRPRGPSLCRRCRRQPNAGSVMVRLYKRQPRANHSGQQLAQVQATLCEPCAVYVFEHIAGAIRRLGVEQ
jgi:hypothetical protein